MKFDKEPIDDTARETSDNSSDFEDVCISSTSPSSKRILSSSLSSLECEQTAVDDSDNDSGFVGISQGSLDRLNTAVTPEVTEEINECPVVELPGRNGIYDRDEIISKLIDLGVKSKMLLNYFEVMRLKNMENDKASMKYDEKFANYDKEGEFTDVIFEKPNSEKVREAVKFIPDSLLHLLTGGFRTGDCGRSSDQKPEWLDMEKLKRGQKFAQDHIFSVFYAQMLSLFILLNFEDGLKPMIATGKSNTPFTAFKRYLSTGTRVRHWYMENPWEKGSSARKDILTTRSMHAAVKKRLDASTFTKIDETATLTDPWFPTNELLLEDFSETCPIPEIGQCPYAMGRPTPFRLKPLNQLEMAITQWGFLGLIISYPKSFGVHYASDADIEAFCHLWRSIGYQLGIEDEYNFCRGTIEEIRQRSHDFIETWAKPNFRIITPEWEHMMRCIFIGVGTFLPGATFETALFHLSEILDLDMPRLYAALSYRDWFHHNLVKSLFNYTIKIPGVKTLMNNMLHREFDRAENLAPEKIEYIRNLLSVHPASNAKLADNSFAASL